MCAVLYCTPMYVVAYCVVKKYNSTYKYVIKYIIKIALQDQTAVWCVSELIVLEIYLILLWITNARVIT